MSAPLNTAPTPWADADRSAIVDGVDVDAVTTAVAGCPAVARLDAGTPIQRVASYLPGRQVAGVAVSPDTVSIQVALNWDAQVGALAEQVESAVRGLIGRRALEIRVSDIIVPGEDAHPESVVDRAVDTAGDTAEQVKDKAEDLTDKARDTAEDVADTVADKAEDLTDKARDTAEDVADTVADKADQAKADARDAADAVAAEADAGGTTPAPGTVLTLPVTAEVVITKLVVAQSESDPAPDPDGGERSAEPRSSAPSGSAAPATGQDDGSTPHGADTVGR